MTAIFITGTDTDVGKTVVTSLLVHFLQKHKKRIVPYKPIQSGAIYHKKQWIAPDPYVYSSVNKSEGLVNSYTYLFKKACSPHLAANHENMVIDLKKIEKKIQELMNQYDGVVVEGAGGLFVPLTLDGYCVVDWLEELHIPTVLVSRAGVGTINHTVLSIEALQSRNVPIVGVILNYLEKEDEEIVCDNKQMIEKITGIPILCSVPFIEKIAEKPIEEVENAFQDWKIDIILEAFQNEYKTNLGVK